MLEVHTGYQFDGSFYRDDAATHAAGRPPDFSGCGFGRRDMGWTCTSEFEANRIKRALEKIGLVTVVSLPIANPQPQSPQGSEEANG